MVSFIFKIIWNSVAEQSKTVLWLPPRQVRNGHTHSFHFASHVLDISVYHFLLQDFIVNLNLGIVFYHLDLVSQVLKLQFIPGIVRLSVTELLEILDVVIDISKEEGKDGLGLERFKNEIFIISPSRDQSSH